MYNDSNWTQSYFDRIFNKIKKILKKLPPRMHDFKQLISEYPANFTFCTLICSNTMYPNQLQNTFVTMVILPSDEKRRNADSV